MRAMVGVQGKLNFGKLKFYDESEGQSESESKREGERDLRSGPAGGDESL